MVMPRVANLSGSEWRGEAIAALMRDDKARHCLVNKIVKRLVELEADGVNVDIEELAPEDTEPLLELLVDLKNALHPKGLRLSVDVSFYDPAYDLEFIGQLADATFVMAYDQHYPSSMPGPISGKKWFDDSVQQALQRVPKDRIVVALGGYCYDWTVMLGAPPAEGLSFREAMDRARAANAMVEFERDAENARFGYSDGEQRVHEVWCQDALSAWNQTALLHELGLSRVALWRLGTEDETMWTFLNAKKRPKPNVLATIPESKSVDLFGEGEVLTIRAEPTQGRRDWRWMHKGACCTRATRRRPRVSWWSDAAPPARSWSLPSTMGPIRSRRRCCSRCSRSSRCRPRSSWWAIRPCSIRTWWPR
jgi:hypothetical protein